MTILRGALIAAVLLAASTASAGTQNDAGCGLGSQVFKENDKVSQILAATTNGIFGNQTLGITFGTLGCGDSAPRASNRQETFVATNFRDLSREFAAGKGEYLSALASLLGCRDASALGGLTQRRYDVLFPAGGTEPLVMLKTLRSEIAADPGLASSCSVIA